MIEYDNLRRILDEMDLVERKHPRSVKDLQEAQERLLRGIVGIVENLHEALGDMAAQQKRIADILEVICGEYRQYRGQSR